METLTSSGTSGQAPAHEGSGGLIDALDRVLKQLIDTPKFKEAVMILLKAVDPPAARGLVRTLLWRDPGLSMSFMGTMPALLNACSHAAAELASQLSSMPPPLLRELVASILERLDVEALGEAAAGVLRLVSSLAAPEDENPVRRSAASLFEDLNRSFAAHWDGVSLKERLSRMMAGAAQRAKEEGSPLHAFIRDFREALEENPDFARHVMRPLLGSAPSPPRGRAARKAEGLEAGQDLPEDEKPEG